MATSRFVASTCIAVALAALAACEPVNTALPDAGGDDIDAPVEPVIDAPVGPDAPGMATLTLVKGGAGAGTITSDPSGIDCGGTCTFAFPIGTVVTLTATPGTGAEFTGWGGACAGSLPTCSITLDGDKAVDADFAVSTHTVMIVVAGNGSGTVTSSTGGINCPGTCTATLPYGTQITLNANTAAPSMFLGWSGGTCTGTGACTFDVRDDVTINASFALNFTLVVTKAGTGTGTVSSNPAGIDCGPDCDQTYGAGTMVTLTAAPTADSTFTGWSGSGCTGTSTCTVTVNGAAAVVATFTLRRYTVAVTKNGTGAGTVTSNPAGINCGGTCSADFDHGTMVTLTASPTGSGNVFTGWSGGGCTGSGTCTLTVTAAASVTATFDIAQYTLSITKAGTGSGTVTSTPAGINCGATCSASFAHGTSILLTAAALTTPLSADSTFTGWSGGGCSGTANCMVTLTAAATVTATFTLKPNLVFVTSTTHTGNLGGLVGADAICQARAQAGGLSGTFRAWLSTSTVSAVSRLGTASGWTRVDGRAFAATRSDLTQRKILYTLSLDELGGNRADLQVRTGTDDSGVFGSGDCNAWTSNSSTISANTGFTSYGSGAWTTNGSDTCAVAQPIYCFGIDRNAIATVPVPAAGSVRRAFVSNGWAPSGGLAGADAFCQAEATAAGLTGTYRALLASFGATGGITAASRFTTNGSPWARVDNVILDSTATAFLSANTTAWDAALNVRASGSHGVTRAWAGAGTLNTGGSQVSTCGNWTNASASADGYVGIAFSAIPTTAFANYDTAGNITDCDSMHSLYCLQQ
jgi:trimeric autotransporter adhesin